MIVGEVEAGDYGASEKGEFSVSDKTRALPYASRNEDLDLLTCSQILSEDYDGGGAVGKELQHLDGVAEVEVEDFVGIEEVHLGECSCFEQVVDCGALGTGAAGCFKISSRRVGSPVVSALDGVRIEVEQPLDFVCGHAQIVAGLQSRIELYESAGLYRLLVQGLPGG